MTPTDDTGRDPRRAAAPADTHVGVVVMAYGTPGSIEEIEAYYTHIRRGRRPSAEELDRLRRRYEAIGGTSPLREITEAQAARLQSALGDGFLVRLGQKHAAPFIEDAVASLASDGAERVVGLVLAPHYSRSSVGEYLERMRESAAIAGLSASGIESWWDLEEWIDFQSRAVLESLAGMPEATVVVFSAHSLPERVLDGDPYPDELHASALAIAQRAGVARWQLAFQSASRTADAWRGPDLFEVIEALASAQQRETEGVLVCAQGFTSDHLEVLYDLDIAVAAAACDRGLAFARARTVNDDGAVLRALAARVRAA